MHKPGRWIEKGCIRNSCNRPLIADCSHADVDFHQRAVIASDVDSATALIDIKSVRAATGKRPLLNFGQVWQSGNQHHGRITDREKNPLGSGICCAPAWTPREIDGVLLSSIKPLRQE